MALNKKLIHFKTYSNFIGSNGINGATLPTSGYYGNIPENSIVFIQDSKQIWTHGQFYSCPYTKEEIDALFVGSNVVLTGYSVTESPVDITADDTVNEAIAKIDQFLLELSEADSSIRSQINNLSLNKVDKDNAVTSVAGRIGAVVLTKDDVGLSNVDNTADADKNVASAVSDSEGNKIVTTYATKAEIPTNTSSLTNDSGFIVATDTDEIISDIEANVVTDAVRKSAQTLTDAEKTQVLTNIGAVEEAPMDGGLYVRQNGKWIQVTL